MSATRPEAGVQRVLDAFTWLDSTGLTDGLTDVTAAELAEGQALWLASTNAASDHRDREVEVIDVLMDGRTWSTPPTLGEMFDGLDAAAVDRLRDLYDAMTDDVRAEFDRRYGTANGGLS